MAPPSPPAQQRRSIAARSAAFALAAIIAVVAWSDAFVGVSRPAPLPARCNSDGRMLHVARSAEDEPDNSAVEEEEEAEPEGKKVDAEAPPKDADLYAMSAPIPRPYKRFRYKRDIPGTISYYRREMTEEAQRFRPYLEPLLEMQLSKAEITFVLNRRASELRHLLWLPRCGVPAFTQHKVKRLLARNRTPKGRLHKYVRPHYLPPRAPGCRYPYPMKQCYAEVPPLPPYDGPSDAWKEQQKLVDEMEAKKYIDF